MSGQLVQSNEDIKEYLKSLQALNILIDSKRNDINRLRDLAISVRAINKGEKIRTSNIGGNTDNIIISIIELEQNFKELVEEYINKRKEFNNILSQMSIKERTLLELKYINGLTWGQVAKKMNYSEQQIYRLCSKSLNNLKKIKDDSK